MMSLDSSHGPTMENPPEKERAAPPQPLLLSPARSPPPTRPAGKAPSSEICERWPPPCCGGRVKLSWDGFILLPPPLPLPLAVDG